METKKLLQTPQHTARIKRIPKNMSHNVKFTSSTGMLLPLYYDFLYPGDKLRISDMLYTLTKPMQQRSLVSLTEHIEYFFVPAHLLWSKFPDFISGVHGTPFTSIPDRTDLPFFQLDRNTAPQFWDNTIFDPKTRMPISHGVRRLMEHLGFSSDLLGRIKRYYDDAGTEVFRFNFMRHAAYQKIVQDYYFREDWDDHNMRDFNADKGIFNSATDCVGLLSLRTAPFKKDFFTNIFPQEYFSNNSFNVSPSWLVNSSPTVLGLDNDLDSMLNQWYKLSPTHSQRILGANYKGEELDGDTQGNAKDALYGYAQSQTDLQERPIGFQLNLAMNKLARITNFAKKDYVSQIAAHFGFKVNSFLSYKSIKIKSHSQPLNIQPVVSTAETSDGNLASMASYGSSQGTMKPHDFVAPCHGIFMAIYSCIPEADYLMDGIDEFNTRHTKNDFFTPELDKLGMVPFQPVWSYLDELPDSQNGNWDALTYRYLEEKLKYNKVLGAFKTSMNNYVITRNIETIQHSAESFYIPCNYLDNVMLVAFDGTVETDPLYHVCRFDVVKNSQHSMYGLTSL